MAEHRPADRVTVGLACVAALLLSVSLSNTLSWLQGFVNTQIYALVIDAICLVTWFVLALVLAGRVAFKMLGTTSTGRVAYVLLVGLASIPWFALAFHHDATAAFFDGFGRWAARVVDSQAILRWAAENSELGPPVAVPLWWPTTEPGALLGAPVQRASWPPVITALGPNEVRILTAPKGVLLTWEGGRAGWVRFVFVGDEASGPPGELRRLDVEWRTLKPALYGGILEPR